MIIFIAAHDKNFGMGYKDKLPWPLMPHDKANLHKLASGKKLVMGERTYHNYKNIQAVFQTNDVIVLSNSVKELPDAKIAHSIEEIIKRSETEELWILGGGNVFKQLLPHADIMFITVIKGVFVADTFFPRYHLRDWNNEEELTFKADEENPYSYTFLKLTKKT